MCLQLWIIYRAAEWTGQTIPQVTVSLLAASGNILKQFLLIRYKLSNFFFFLPGWQGYGQGNGSGSYGGQSYSGYGQPGATQGIVHVYLT